MFVIDTNILAAEILREYEDDPLTTSYLAFYQQLPLMKRVIPDFILNEFETLMTQVVPSRYNLDDEQKRHFRTLTCSYLKKLVEDHTIITPSPQTVKEAFSLYDRYHTTHYVSFTDSLLLALAKQEGFTLLTKDQRVNHRAKELEIGYYMPSQ
jgi:predicted nucleic acid-binding protein